jgi:hypothetical protein
MFRTWAKCNFERIPIKRNLVDAEIDNERKFSFPVLKTYFNSPRESFSRLLTSVER